MAENSRKNEFFERESIAMMAITTNNSMSVNCDFRNFIFILSSDLIILFLMWIPQ